MGKGDKKMKVSLDIDWDFFFDDTEMDWGHAESPFFIHHIWDMRAMDFRLAGENIQDYAPQGADNFLLLLKTLNLCPPAVYVGESHLYAWETYMSFTPDLLLHFDSHADMSPKHPEYLDCENWLYWLLKRKPKMKALWVIPNHSFPIHEGDNLGKLPNFDCIQYSAFEEYWKRSDSEYKTMLSYTCRSGAWTPPWADEQFDRFVNALSFSKLYHERKPLTPRKFTPPSEEEVERIRRQNEKVLSLHV
jgi:hypothetical protein